MLAAACCYCHVRLAACWIEPATALATASIINSSEHQSIAALHIIISTTTTTIQLATALAAAAKETETEIPKPIC